MLSVLRVYSKQEWEGGASEDWERCQNCGGDGRVVGGEDPDGSIYSERCESCDGFGSLRAAARWRNELFPRDGLRCEDCGHPMSEGTWVAPDAEVPRLDTAGLLTGIALQALRQGVPEPKWENGLAAVHYSPCDEGCRHGDGGLRLFDDSGEPDAHVTEGARENADEVIAAYRRMGRRIEASWRPVDVRRLSWDHDLRPEQLAVLCLRCWAERTRA